MYNILICDDEIDIVNALKIYLKNEEYKTFPAYSGKEALEIIAKETIHLVLMDIMMPEMDGIQTVIKIRETQNIPVLFLSAKSEDQDKILGLHIGADDYITKPFNPLEVIARIKAQLRRYTQLNTYKPTEYQINIGGIILDDQAKTLVVDGKDVNLTPIEYKILHFLMSNANHVFSSTEIYEKIWQEPSYGVENTVSVHIRHLREKIEIDPSSPRYIKVIWGTGYKFEKSNNND